VASRDSKIKAALSKAKVVLSADLKVWADKARAPAEAAWVSRVTEVVARVET
jgi:hypothetical protein